MRNRDVSLVINSKVILIISLFLFLILFAQPVETQNSTILRLNISEFNQTDLNFNFRGANYTITNLSRGDIVLGKPVNWELLLTNGVELFTINYETSPIYLFEEESIDNTSWEKNVILKTDFEQGYDDVTILTHIKSSNNVSLEPNYAHEIKSQNHIEINFPHIKNESFVIKGNTNANYNKIVFQTKDGPMLFDVPNGMLNYFSITRPLMDFAIVNVDTLKPIKISIFFPYEISNTTKFFIYSDLKSQQINLPYKINNSEVIIDATSAYSIFSQLSNQELHIYGEVFEKEKEQTQFALTTNKETYLLGDELEAFVTPQNATTFMYILTPGGSVSLLSNNTYKTKEVGLHEIEASIHYGDETLTLYKNITVINQTKIETKKEASTSLGVFTLETVEGYIKDFTMDDDLEINFTIQNISANNQENITLSIPTKLPNGVHTYIWMKNNHGKYLNVPFNVSTDGNTLSLFLKDGLVDVDGEIDGVIKASFKLFLSPREAIIAKQQNNEKADVHIFRKEQTVTTNDNSRLKVSAFQQELSSMSITTSKGHLGNVLTVNPENIPVKSNNDFVSDLLKFKVENIDAGDFVDLEIALNSMPANPKIMKFNPNTLEWYSFPAEKINNNTLRIRIQDGGIGDDDGLANGIIEDDLGITNNWWDGNWNWRNVYTLSDAGENITDLEVPINISSINFNFSKAKEDLSDLRFTYYNLSSDTEIEMNYWMESDNSVNYSSGNLSALFWVKVPYVEEGTNTTIFIYYGNSAASSESNGSATFLLFDDFEGSSLNTTIWATNFGSNVEVSNGSLRLWGGWNAGGHYLASNNAFTGPAVLESRVRVDDYTTDSDLSLGFVQTQTSEWWCGAGCTWVLYDGVGGGGSSNKDIKIAGAETSGLAIESNNWEKIKVLYSTTQIDYYDSFTDSYLTATGTSPTTYYISLAGDSDATGAGYNDYFDYVFLRKRSAFDINTTFLGEEYSGILNISIDYPLDLSEKTRYQTFEMNGTVNCSRGDCGNVSVYYQYYSTASPLQSFIETTTSEFATYDTSTNITGEGDKLSLNFDVSGLSWWDSDWKYRQEFNVSNTAGTAYDYAVKINIDNASAGVNLDWLNDENSTRFVWYNSSSSSYVALSYFIQDWNESTENATIWVKIPELLGSQNTTIFMYYNNPVVLSQSNGVDVFPFYMDFNTLTMLPEGSGSSQDTDGYGEILDSGRTFHTWGNSWKVFSGIPSINILNDGSQVLEMSMLSTNCGEIQALFFDTDTVQSNANCYKFCGSQNYCTTPDQTYTDLNNWQEVGTVLNDFTITPSFVHLTRDYDVATPLGDVYYKDVRVRTPLLTEPTIYVGAESTGSYFPSGLYISDIYDVGTTEVALENISWTNQTNPGNTITVYSRTSNGAESLWFDSDWNYRTQINLTNTAGDLINYTQIISINTTTLNNNGKIKADCSDMRFFVFDSVTTDQTELPYYFDSCEIAGKNTTFYVMISDFTNNTVMTVDMYYGNPAASPAKNGSAAFLFFDDFETFNNWTSYNGGAVSQDNTRVFEGSYSAHKTTNSDPGGAYKNMGATIGTDIIYEGWVNRNSAYSGGASDRIGIINDLGDGYGWVFTHSGGTPIDLEERTAYATTTLDSTSVSNVVDDWVMFNLIIPSNGSIEANGYYNDALLGSSTATDTSTTSFTNVYIFGGYDYWIDALRVRKIVGSSPTISIDSEQDYATVINNSNNFFWTPWFLESNNNHLQSPDGRYLQYKILFATTNTSSSPSIEDMSISYRKSTNDWTNMLSSTTLFTTNSPYSCGILNQSQPICNPTLNVLPKNVGDYSLRLKAFSSIPEVNFSTSSFRNISVWMQPIFSDYSAQTNPVAINQSTTLSVTLFDDTSSPLENYNVTFYDETANGTRYYIGSALSSLSGVAEIEYLLPSDSIIGTHTLNVSYLGNISQYIKSANLTNNLVVSSKPQISNVTINPLKTGFGLNISIDANITDSVGLDTVFINVTNSTGSWSVHSLNFVGGFYEYIFTDSWTLDEYTFTIFANNTDGILTTYTDIFSTEAYAHFNFTTNKDNYASNELVTISEYLPGISDWNYTGWSSRKIINITSFEDSYNYETKLTLTSTNFNFQDADTQGADIRFTYNNNTDNTQTRIPYWIESWNATNEEAIVWVQVPFLNASSSNSIYMYYGNKAASSESNSSATFIFFDDFETFSGWTTQGSGNLAQDSTRAYSGTYSAHKISNSDPNGAYKLLPTSIGRDVVLEAWVNRNSGYTGGQADRIGLVDNSGNGYGWIYNHGSGIGVDTRSGWTGTIGSYDNTNPDVMDEWIFARFYLQSDGNLKSERYVNGSISGEGTDNDLTYSSFTRAYILGGYDYWVDDMRVRHFMANEPNILYGNAEFSLSGLQNVGETDISGYLRMHVQYWTGATWQNLIPPVLDQQYQTVNASGLLNISGLWENAGSWNTSTNTPGLYRVRAILEDDSRNLLIDSDGAELVGVYEFNILEPAFVVSNLTYENNYLYNLNEYEVGDVVDWINTTVLPYNNTAYDANVTLSILDQSSNYVGWGPQNETKYCGDLNILETCERQWDNSSNGYNIPYDASSGEYAFFWNVDMSSSNGPTQKNDTNSFIIHNIPSTIQTSLSVSRLYKPNSSIYNITFNNTWSKNLTGVTMAINCPSISGFTCEELSTSNTTVILGDVDGIKTVSFNITINESVTSDNYLINITLNYTNPAGEFHSWSEKGVEIIEARLKGILEITDYQHPTNITRQHTYDFSAHINNTGDDDALSSSINYTLPNNWIVVTGNEKLNVGTINPTEIAWNNISVTPNILATLGSQNVRLDSQAVDGRNDFKIYPVIVYADTSISYTANESLVNTGETILLTGRLLYDNGNPISGANITFKDETAGTIIGYATTNATGYATTSYLIPTNSSLGYHTLNVTYSGKTAIYSRASQNTTIIDIHEAPKISSVTINPSIIGYGNNVTISATVTDADDIASTYVLITYPNGSITTEEMGFIPPFSFSYVFNDTWKLGTYNISLIANDTTGAVTIVDNESFTLDADLSLSLQTLNNSYGQNVFVNLTEGYSPWWNNSFSYALPINISNTAGDLYNYQVVVSIDTATAISQGKMNADCSDVRFTYYNSSSNTFTLLSHFNDGNCSTVGNTFYYVKVPYLKNNINTTLYAYYGNAQALDIKNPQSTFDFFDDFETFSGWTTHGSGDVSQDSTMVYEGTYSAHKISNSDPNGAYKSLGSTWGRNITLEFLVNRNSSYTGGGSDRIGLVDSSGNGYGWVYSHGSGLAVDTRSGWSGSISSTVDTYGDVTDDWVLARFKIQPGTGLLSERYINNVLGETQTDVDGTYSSFDTVYILGGYDYWIDNLRVRKLASTEPIVNLGSEKNMGSAIRNTGSTDSYGYLYLKVQYNNSGVWQDVATVINDVPSTKRFVNLSGLDISNIWNTISWDTASYVPGTYRVYGELHDPNGNLLESNDGSDVLGYWTFEIENPELFIDITSIDIYDVSDTAEVNWHYYTNELIASGLNQTYTLTKDGTYRVEITVQNIGTGLWNINETNLSYLNFNPSWNIDTNNHLWYSTQSTIANRRLDTTKIGGLFDGNVSWNISGYGGSVASGNKVTFFAIVNTTTEEDKQTIFNISHATFEKTDYSIYQILAYDTTPPQIINSNYYVTPINVTRGNTFTVVGQWNEILSEANLTYSTTTALTEVAITNSSPANYGNWTKFTVSSLSTWYRGIHTTSITAVDESGNINDSLGTLAFTVWGLARITDSQVNETVLDVGETLDFSCKVTDYTKSGSAISSYVVTFSNGTQILGTNTTDASGWAHYSYTDNSIGEENITCTISENTSSYYLAGTPSTTYETITTRELIAPTYTTVSYPNLAHKGDNVNLAVQWHDNYLLANATLATNASGSLINITTQSLSGSDDLANITYQISNSMSPGQLSWKQYGADYYNNKNQTNLYNITIWGYSEISDSSLVPSNIQETNSTRFRCKVRDAGDLNPLENYTVTFYYKLSSSPTYTYLGYNSTGIDGNANYTFSVATAGSYDVLCNITDDSSKKYNVSGATSTKLLNVVSGTDISPPKIVGTNYAISATSIYRGDCFTISGLWDENINDSYVQYNKTPGVFTQINITPPYTANWTNQTICTNETWNLTNYDVKLFAKDDAGNINNTLAYKTIQVKGHATITWQSPAGNQDRGVIDLYCNVSDSFSGIPIENYLVTFYDGDIGGSIGSSYTNASGVATISHDYGSANVGPDQLSCSIGNSPTLNYDYLAPSLVSSTIYLYGTLTPTISLPTNNAIIHRGQSQSLNANVIDENGLIPKNQYGATASLTSKWWNSTPTQLATGKTTSWNIPNAYSLGDATLTFNTTASYYHSGNDEVNVTTFGYSKVTLQTPSTGVYGDNTLLNVTCLVSDATAGGGINSYEVNITRNGTLVLTSTTNSTGQLTYQVNTNTLSEGDYEFMCEIGNDASKYYTKTNPYMSTVFINIDKVAPTIDYNPTTDNSGNYARNWILINVSAYDQNLDTTTLNWSGTNYAFTNNQGNNYWRNMSSLSEGTYTFNAIANDVSGASNQTSLRTVIIDLNNPVLNIILPINQSYTNQTSTALTYTVSDLTLDNCWYSLNNGVNQTLASCTNTTVNSLVEGRNNITVYANDSVGHESSKQVMITRDTINPSLTVEAPTNLATYQSTAVELNYTVSDINPISKCWYKLNSGTNQIIASCTNTTLNGLSNGIHNLTVSVNDSAGNINSTLLQFNISYFVLVATPIYPQNNTVITTTNTYANVSTNIDATECNYTLDESITASTTTSNNRDWSTSLSSLTQGNHNISFTCTNGANTSITGKHFFTVDSIGPVISFVTPTPANNTGREVDWAIINVSLNENGNSAILEWTNLSGSYNFSMTNTSLTHFYYNISSLEDATYTYKVYANDSYDNTGISEERTVIVTTQEPVIIIHNPIQDNEYAATTLNLDVSATKEIATWRFNLNGEEFFLEPNITFAPKFGSNELTVWGTDLYGLTGNASVNFTVNATRWTDTFGSYTGLSQSTNLNTGSNASTLFCWPVLFSNTIPQYNPATCWPYRRNINLSTATTLTDYQIKLELNLSNEVSAEKVNLDCSDLRFSYSNYTGGPSATTPYWIESCNNAESAIVWVKIPRINDSTQIQVYYGNKYAVDESNGSAVFNFFDEMDAISTSDWGTNAIRWDSANNQSYPNTAGSTAKITSSYTTPSSYATELWLRSNSSSGAAGYYGIGTASKYMNLYFEPASNRVNLYNGANNYYTINSSAMQKYTLISDFTNNNYTLFVNNSPTAAISLVASAFGGQPKPVMYPYYVQGLFVDRVAIRSYSNNNPTQSVLGLEKTPVVNTTMQSELIMPDKAFNSWDTLTASTNIPSGTTIIFRILNETNSSVCGDITAAQLIAGYEPCAQTGNKSIYLYAELTTDTTLKTASILNWSINWSSDLVIIPNDLYIDSIIFSNTSSIIEGEDVIVSVNISNNGTADANNFKLQLNKSIWNGTKTFQESANSSLISIPANDWLVVNFTWNASVGTYIFDAYADIGDVILESNETNNLQTTNATISIWHIRYGTYQYDLMLTNNINETLYNWSTLIPQGNLLYADADSSYYPFDLAGLNGVNDLNELDQALGTSGYVDSIRSLYDKDNNGVADKTISATIAGNLVSGIPVVNTTNSSSFVTGILWDSSDGASYTGAEDVVFITFLNASQVGYYGTYDFEVRLPSKLESLFGGINSVNQYLEVK